MTFGRNLFLVLLILLAGCEAGTKSTEQSDRIDQRIEEPRRPARSIGVASTRAEIVANDPPAAAAPSQTSSMASDTISSNSVTKNDVQGIVGAQFDRVAEKIDASLVKVQSAIDVSLQNKLDVALKANAELHAQLAASVKLSADLSARVDALAQAQAGLGNKIDQQTNTISSGRDTTQFTKEMQQMVENITRSSDRTIYLIFGSAAATVLSVFGLLIKLLREKDRLINEKEESRKRAENRFCEVKDVVLKGKRE